MDDDHQMFKIVIIGNSGTGKTNISTRYVRNEFNDGQKATVGVQFLYKIIDLHNKKIKVTLWDTAGQEKYKGLSKVYYKGASGVLIVYDITDPQSYLDVESWMKLANENLNLSEVVLMVVGNKADLEEERKVPTERPIREFKEKFDIDCWEVSAKTGFNVKEVMAQFVEKIYQMNLEPKGSQIPLGESYFGESVLEQGSIYPPTKQKVQKSQNPIPEVIVEEQPQVRHSAPRKKGKKQNNIVLSVHEDRKRKKEKEKKKKNCC